MDTEAGKLFIGGLSWETTEDGLRDHFSSYGEVSQVVVMRDKLTSRPRGFAFVAFADPSTIDRVLQDSHTIDNRTVEAKRALSREEQTPIGRNVNPGSGRVAGGGGSSGNVRTKKIFVGGLPPSLEKETFHQHFQTFGNVTDVVIMYDSSTNRPRGFGFISFDTEDAVDRVLQKTFHELNGKMVEVKRALPKDANPGVAGGRTGGGSGYQPYGGSGPNTSYDGRMDSNRYMQQQAAGGGYSAYGSSGYGAPNYGYGAGNNGASYGAYSGFSSTPGGYSGPAGPYGNPNVSQVGYGSGPPGAPRSPWNNQAPSYGSAGYGTNPGYGPAATWNAPGTAGGSGTAPTGQSSGGSSAYGNQGYGFGGYGGGDASYINQGGYAAVGGRGTGPNPSGGGSVEQGTGSGYMGQGYGDSSGNAVYQSSWRSEAAHGYGTGQANGASGGPGYGGGFGGSQPRQTQQQ